MSDKHWIERAVARGALVRLPAPPDGRRVLLKERVWLQLDGTSQRAGLSELDQARCLNKLQNFAEGVEFSASLSPFDKGRETDLALTDAPDEWTRGIWTIRLHEDRPYFRLFGAFAARDCFVVLTLKNRDEISDFTEEVRTAAAEWDRISGANDRLLEGTIDGHASKCVETSRRARRRPDR